MKKKLLFLNKIKNLLIPIVSEEKKLEGIRNALDIDCKFCEKKSIIIKIAQTESELNQALVLLQQTYQEIKVIDKNPNDLRINKYNVLPTSTIFVAKIGEEVIGTVTQVYDTAIGLPIDGHTDISKLRMNGEKICEISGLAVKSKWRNSNVFIPLVTFVLNYLKFKVNARYTVIVINRNAADFYKAVFLFNELSGKEAKYKDLNDYSAMAFYIDNSNVYSTYESLYSNLKDSKNLYKMICNPVWENSIIRPQKISKVSIEPFYDEKILKKIIKRIHQINLFDELLLENMLLINLNKMKGLKSKIMFATERINPRISVNMHLDIDGEDSEIIDISLTGICFLSKLNYKLGQNLALTVYVDSMEKYFLSATVVWINNCRVGLVLNGGEIQEWEKYIHFLYGKLNIDFQKTYEDAC